MVDTNIVNQTIEAIEETETPSSIEDIIQDSAEIRYNLNENLHRQASRLKTSFCKLFVTDNKRAFTKYKDFKYYRGGWPSEKTPPRIESFADSVADMLHLFEIVGDNELRNLLIDRGIDYNVTDTKRRFPNVNQSNVVIEQFHNLADSAISLQKEICCEADKIKIDNYEKIKSTSGKPIKKGDFQIVVQSEYRKMKELDNEKIIKRIEESVTSLEIADEMISMKE